MLNDNIKFDEYAKQHGSRFTATMLVAEQARYLAEKHHNVITHAQALHWVLSGETPEEINNQDTILKRRKFSSLMSAKEYLSNITDTEIKQSVLKSLWLSNKAGHLIYYYKEVYEPERQARIRILTRKLWYELDH